MPSGGRGCPQPRSPLELLQEDAEGDAPLGLQQRCLRVRRGQSAGRGNGDAAVRPPLTTGGGRCPGDAPRGSRNSSRRRGRSRAGGGVRGAHTERRPRTRAADSGSQCSARNRSPRTAAGGEGSAGGGGGGGGAGLRRESMAGTGGGGVSAAAPLLLRPRTAPPRLGSAPGGSAAPVGVGPGPGAGGAVRYGSGGRNASPFRGPSSRSHLGPDKSGSGGPRQKSDPRHRSCRPHQKGPTKDSGAKLDAPRALPVAACRPRPPGSPRPVHRYVFFLALLLSSLRRCHATKHPLVTLNPVPDCPRALLALCWRRLTQ